MPTTLALLYLVTVSIRVWLTTLNVRYRRQHGNEVPAEFADSIELAALQRSSRYSAAREGFGLVRLLCFAAIVIVFLFGGGLGAYDRWVANTVYSRLGQGVLFFVGLKLASSLLELPFDVIYTFRIEQRHGFNRTTPQLFLVDWLKSTLLGLVLAVAVSTAGLALYYAAPQWYWLWFWAFGMALTLLLMLIAPYVIEPLFIKTSPLSNLALADAVRELSARAGVKVTRVLQMDASRRSSHSNAYFTGIGHVKRVVLFDTLLARLTDIEVLAVLAHELGHWKLRHITKRLVVTAFLGLLILYTAAQLLTLDGFSGWVGLGEASVPAQVVLLAFIASIIGFFLSPLSAFWSRRDERQADAFASELTGQKDALASALIKLAKDNLTNLHPHPWYAAFYYSHPPTTVRVRQLRDETVSS